MESNAQRNSFTEISVDENFKVSCNRCLIHCSFIENSCAELDSIMVIVENVQFSFCKYLNSISESFPYCILISVKTECKIMMHCV